MLATDITLDASTAIPVGTSAAVVYSLLSGGQASQSIRNASAYAQTNPRTLKLAHQVRVLKGLKTVANASVPAPNVIFDRHQIRADDNVVQTTHLDPEYSINFSTSVVLEVPRMGASTPTVTMVADQLKRLVALLTASSNANLIRVLNLET